MKRIQFTRFASDLIRLGSAGVGKAEFVLGKSGKYELQYIPFDHVNRDARIVIVGITPGNTQLGLAYETAQKLLNEGVPEDKILWEVKKAGSFGGSSMRPNLLKMLRHFNFEKLLGIEDVTTLWGENAELLHSTSVVPHAAFKDGKMFNGSFDEVISSPLLKECFIDSFVSSVSEMKNDTLFVGLGPCPQAALEWCIQNGYLRREQVLGSFCHPSGAGGSTTKYYLRQVSKDELDPNNPVRHRCDWLDEAYNQMKANTSALLGVDYQVPTTSRSLSLPLASKVVTKAIAEKKPRKIGPVTQINSAEKAEEIAILLKEFTNAGYNPTNETKKLAEYKSLGGQTIYLVKNNSRLNSINIMVHPGIKVADLIRMNGVDSVDDQHRFHSNMTRFPKRLNTGVTETAFGWQVKIDTISNLQRFLSDFKNICF